MKVNADVDAITFADRDWYYIPEHGLAIIKVEKRTWLKFPARIQRCALIVATRGLGVVKYPSVTFGSGKL